MAEEIDQNWVVLSSNTSSTLPPPDDEDDHLTVFTNKFNKKIEEKRNFEYESDKNSRAKAEEEYSNWKNQRSIRLKAKMDANRQEETLFVSTLYNETDCLKIWDNVGKLINTQLTDSVEYKGPDLSRMKKLLIDLKNSPLIVKDTTTVDVITKWNSNPLNNNTPNQFHETTAMKSSNTSPILSNYAPSVNPLVPNKRSSNARSMTEELDSELQQEQQQQTEVISDIASHDVKIIDDEE